ncbi:MAG: hypothetical protein QGI45_04055, partial [Myxococcota bacterium]|nr:hypothetical protein [Myxococcota bacterium]
MHRRLEQCWSHPANRNRINMKEPGIHANIQRQDLLLFLFLSFSIAWVLLYVGISSILDAPDYRSIYSIYKAYLSNFFLLGEVPFWNPYQALGRPFLADIETGVFYPTTLLHVFLPEEIAFFFVVALHLFLAALFMHRLSLELHGTRFVACFCAIAFISSGAVLVRLMSGAVHVFETITLMPWLLYVAVKIQRKYTFGLFVQLILVLSLSFLAGHTQFFWNNCVGLGFFVLGRRLFAFEKGESIAFIKDSLFCLFALGLCFSLIAFVLLPTLEFYFESVREADV